MLLKKTDWRLTTKWEYPPSQTHNYVHTHTIMAIARANHRCLPRSCVLYYMAGRSRFPLIYISGTSHHQNISGLVPAQDVTFFYTGSNLSELQSCALTFSINFYFIFIFKYCTTKFSHWIVLCTKNNSIFSRLFSKLAQFFVAIELLAFSKNTKFLFYCSRELSVFGLNIYIYSLRKKDFFLFFLCI